MLESIEKELINTKVDWQIKKLEDIAKVERGKFTARPRNDPKYYGGDIPFVQTGDITSSRGELKTYSQTLNQDGLKVSKLFPKGSILITIAANIGDVALTSIDVACPDSIVVVRAKEGVSQKWLSYALSFNKKQMEAAATQNAQKNINLQVIRPLQILTPSLEEQKKIAEILSHCDRAIELTEKLIASKQKLKRGLMQKLLTEKVRFSEFKGHNWKWVSLKSCTEFIKDGTHGTHKRVSQGIPLLSAINIEKDGTINFQKSSSYISQEDYKFIHKKYEIKVNDILLTVVGTLGRKALVKPQHPKFSLQRSVAIIRANEDILPAWIYHYFESERFQHELQKRANVTAQAGVYLNSVEKLKVPKPSIKEQEKIVKIFDDIEKEIQILQKTVSNLKQQKKGLMQQLLTGKTRVPLNQ